MGYTAPTLGAGAGGVYRLGGGSGANDSSSPPSILTFSGTDNLLTGARSVVIGSASLFQTSDARPVSTVVLQNPNNYSGGTTLVGGTLVIGNDLALESGPLTIVADIHRDALPQRSSSAIAKSSGCRGAIKTGQDCAIKTGKVSDEEGKSLAWHGQ